MVKNAETDKSRSLSLRFARPELTDKNLPVKRRTCLAELFVSILTTIAFCQSDPLNAADSAVSPKTNAPPDQVTAAEKARLQEAELIKTFEKEENVTNSLGMVMVWLPGGYRVAPYEITQSQYEQIMGDNPSKFPGAQYPVDSITLDDATRFCKKLTDKEVADHKLPKGYYYSLPSEGQWEFYVAEASLKNAVTSYYGDRKNPENVGIFPPNKFGLYDTRGSVWDLCDNNMARGGSWRSYDDYVFIQFRFALTPGQRYDDIGFRIILQGKAQPGLPAVPAAAAQAAKAN
jgi:hypothetical protein